MKLGELYQRYPGIYLAEVVGVDDSDKLGRIRLKSDQFEDTDDQPILASIARPAAGDKTGVFFTPKVGDQVALAFHAGDCREPIVLGCVHSTDRKPDTDNLVGTKTHGIVTAVGSVTFNEDDNKKQIVVTFTDPKSTVTLDKDGITLDFKDSTSKVTLDKDGIKLAFDKSKVTLDKDGITLEGSKITITGTDSISLKADAITVGEQGKKVKVTGKAVLLHDFVSDVFNNHFHTPESTNIPTPAVLTPGTDETMT